MQELGIELPRNIEAEQAVLGAILLEGQSIDVAEQKLVAESFYRLTHGWIFEAMVEITEEGKPIDLVTITGKLQEKGQLDEVGGVSYLADLARAVPTASNIVYYIDLVREKYLHRQALQTLMQQMTSAKDSLSSSELIASIQEAATKLSEKAVSGRSFRSMRDMVRDHYEVLERRCSERKEVTGVVTAGTDLDKLTGGRQKQDLILIGARPSVGKTAFMLNEARKAAVKKSVNAVGIFSLEMNDMKLVDRFICMDAGIDGMKFRNGLMQGDDWERYTMSAGRMSELGIYIDDTPGQTIQEIRAKARAFKREHGEVIFYVDYLQLITAGRKFQNRDMEIGFIGNSLKEMARELDCPVVAITSLGRSVEQRADKRPMLSDLRESGQLEFVADEVDFLYRDDYYDKESEKKNIVEIIVAKGRNTGTGVVEMVYLKNFSKFIDLDRTHQQEFSFPKMSEDEKEKRKWAK